MLRLGIQRGKHQKMGIRQRPSVSKGIRVTVAHLDSPRLDFKPHPVFEDTDLAFFKTHYYGGIKKYQWTTIPLAIRGTVILKDGSKVDVNSGGRHQ